MTTTTPILTATKGWRRISPRPFETASAGSGLLRVPGSPLPEQGSAPGCWTKSQVLTALLSSQCQVTVLTEPSPLPQPPPTSGSEQIGFLKTINCSCPPGEKVHSPPLSAGLGP